MTTLLDSVLKRELTIGGEPYTLTISPEGFSLTVKGRRNGLDIAWADLVGGDAALATALNASLTANIAPRREPAEKEKREAKPVSPRAPKPAGPKVRPAAKERLAARPKTGPAAKPKKPTSPRTQGRGPRASTPRSR